MTELVVTHERDIRILQAARGVRPQLSDADALLDPVSGEPVKFVRCAFTSATYEVRRDGRGTTVQLFGTDEFGHSIAYTADHFRPYLYLSLEAIDKFTSDSVERQRLLETLIAELNRSLLLMSAMQQRTEEGGVAKFTPAEGVAFREATVGYVRRDKLAGGMMRVYTEEEREHCSPVLGYRITEGIMFRGNGPGSGYRGNTPRRFARIEFYCPSLIPKAKSLLHGKNADLGAIMQASRLSRGGRRDKQEDEEPVSTKAVTGGLTRMERAGRDESQRRFRLPEVIDRETTDAVDPGTESDDEDGGGDAELERALDNAEDSHEESDVEEDPEEGDSSPAMDSDLESSSITCTAAQADSMATTLVRQLGRSFIRKCRQDLCDHPPKMLAPGQAYDVCEADVDFILRFAIECEFAYEQWVQIDLDASINRAPDGTSLPVPRVIDRVRGKDRQTRLQLELRGDYRFIKTIPNDPIQNTLPKHVIVSLDCEMLGRPGIFPQAEHDPMITCCFIVRTRDIMIDKEVENKDGTTKIIKVPSFEYRSVSFTLGVVECHTELRQYCTERHLLCFENEARMFAGIAQFVRALDPHIVTGYNTDGFDLPYMVDRAVRLGVGDTFAKAWGRTIYGSKMSVRPASFQSTQAGHFAFNEVRAKGLLSVDLLKALQRDPLLKLRGYGLNAVATWALGQEKEDVPYSAIPDLYETERGRETLRHYCEWDAILPLMISDVLAKHISLIEMSRINVCPMEMILNRGQQVRSLCCLLRWGSVEPVPVRFYTRTDVERATEANDTYEGAVVVKPRPGLYTKPTITLDQNSLYPSSIVSHNLCGSTRVADDYDLTIDPHVMEVDDPVNTLSVEERERRAKAAVYEVEDMTDELPFKEAPYDQTNFPKDEKAPRRATRFLRHRFRVGIVVKVVMKYLEHRKKTKKEMKEALKAGDTAKAAVLDWRQQATKMLANSLYGTLGAPVSRFYSPLVSSTVTRRGRCIIYLMRSIVTLEFAQYGIDVIYGDTDSIFVNLANVETIEKAAEIGVVVAAHISKRMKELYTTDAPEYNIFNLEFEKVFRALLLIAKKRYAGLKYEYSAVDGKLKPSPSEGVPIMSGLESQRRDVTLLVSQGLPDVVALLLDYHYTKEENMERARAYIWSEMARPLLNGTINRRLLIVTKQLRQLPSQYVAQVASGAAAVVPIHVQLAQKLIERAGGEKAANAPRAGARLPYVVVTGAAHEKVSSRAEDPDWALEHNEPIDRYYYMERHVGPALRRIFAPILCANQHQRKLVQSNDVVQPFGATEAARRRANEAVVNNYLFGHITQYYDPVPPPYRDMLIVPPTKKGKPTPRRRPRYTKQVLQVEARGAAGTVTGRQRTLGSSVTAGARCTACGKFFQGQLTGYCCPECTSKRSGTAVTTTLRKYLLDIEELRQERADLVDTCHECMKCREAPTVITCQNTDCSILWDRKQNASSMHELERRLDTAYEMAALANAVERLELEEEK